MDSGLCDQMDGTKGSQLFDDLGDSDPGFPYRVRVGGLILRMLGNAFWYRVSSRT